MGNGFLRKVVFHVIYDEGVGRTSALVEAVVRRGYRREEVVRELVEMGIDGVLDVKPAPGMEQDWRDVRRAVLDARAR